MPPIGGCDLIPSATKTGPVLQPTPSERCALRGMLDGSIPLPSSIGEHVRERQLALAREIQARVPIYLDTRFWIDLRRAEEGDPDKRRHLPLLHALRAAVAGGKAFCPISTSAFIELQSHGNHSVRLRSAQMADDLSMGVSLAFRDEVMEAELEWLMRHRRTDRPDATVVPVWTRLSFALGTIVPISDMFDPEVMLALQVATFDRLWRLSLRNMVDALAEPIGGDFSDHARRMTEEARAHAHEVTDFETVYRSEVAGVAESYAPIAARIMKHLAVQAGAEPEGEPTPDQVRTWFNMVANALAHGAARQVLRTGHVYASLHAVLRLDKQRKRKPGDLLDVEHAAAGTGYCRAFFTEGPLATTLTQPPLQLDQLYECLVTNDPERALAFVAGLLKPSPMPT